MHRTGAAAASPVLGGWRVAIPPTLSPAALFRPHGEVHALEGATMGTLWHVRFVGPAAAVPALRRAIIQILDRVVAHFSPWETGSELNRFNATPPGAWHAASPDFAKVLACALRIAEESGGACDPTLGTLVDLWGFGPVQRRADIPSPSEVERALNLSGWCHIDHDHLGQKFSRSSLARLDLCGIAKGYAVDLVARTLREAGIAAALVEIGGELSGYGTKPDGTPWWVAVDGEAAGNAPLRVALHGIAIATSGSERCFAHAGKSYSHTIDPHTGRPIDNGMISATVLHESCMQADAYATALLAMGPNAAIAFAERHSLAALIRYRVHATDAIMERVSASLQAMLDD
jgi:thiamine biosynthesis lipoprotein